MRYLALVVLLLPLAILAAPGTLRGPSARHTPVIVTTDGAETLTAEQMQGHFHVADHATATSDTTYTLPPAEAGLSGCFYDNGEGGGGITLEIDDADVFLLDGTALDAGDTIDSPGVAGAGANGDYKCVIAIDSTNWVTTDGSGTWVDGGAT